MKKVLYSALAFVLLSMPAAAQKGGGAKHSNKGGKDRGNERAEEVQSGNTKADSHRGFSIAPGVEKAESKKQNKHHDAGKHNGKHKGKHKGKDRH